MSGRQNFGTGHHPAYLRFPLGGPKSCAFNSSRMAFRKRGGAIQLRYRATAEPRDIPLTFGM